MLQNETRRRGAHRNRRIGAARIKVRVDVVEERAFVARLPGTSKLMRDFIEIDRMGRSLDQLFAERAVTSFHGGKCGPNECTRRTRRGSAPAIWSAASSQIPASQARPNGIVVLTRRPLQLALL